MLVAICDRHPDDMTRARTRSFGIDGNALEIDLCPACENELLQAIGEFVEAARVPNGKVRSNGHRVARVPRQALSTTSPAVADEPPAPVAESASPALRSGDLTREQRSEIRAWARENGYHVIDKGSIAQKIVAAYFASH